jgi:hypothetical protein
VDYKDFYLKVAYALSGCQLVEQELKLYISEALELARKCIGMRLTFKLNGDDYADASLERLVEVFRKLTNNDQLVRDLRKFKEERNFLSHRAIVYCLDHEEELEGSAATEIQARLNAIQNEADRLRNEIHEEGNNFRGHLYFGDFSKD